MASTLESYHDGARKIRYPLHIYLLELLVVSLITDVCKLCRIMTSQSAPPACKFAFFFLHLDVAKILKTCPPVASQCWYCGQCCPGNGLGTPPTSLLPDCQGAMSVPHQRGEERAAVPHCRDHSTRLPSEKQYVIV